MYHDYIYNEFRFNLLLKTYEITKTSYGVQLMYHDYIYNEFRFNLLLKTYEITKTSYGVQLMYHDYIYSKNFRHRTKLNWPFLLYWSTHLRSKVQRLGRHQSFECIAPLFLHPKSQTKNFQHFCKCFFFTILLVIEIKNYLLGFIFWIKNSHTYFVFALLTIKWLKK